VLDPETGVALAGEYVVGWIKRGPSGVIGTNKKDAQETVDAMLADLGASNGAGPRRHVPAEPDPASVERLLRERQPELVTYAGWEAIDRHERALGEPTGRPRVKLTRIEEMLRIAASENP
jgi:ferredoxin--NADP+ reductase